MSARQAGPGGTLSLSGALDQSQPLARLLQRLHGSRERFDAIGMLLPDALRSQVRPGALDDDGSWTLLAAHGAAASKLRQLLPELQQALAGHGLPCATIRVRVHSG